MLATGVSAAYYGVPGAAEHSLGLYTRRDAVALRDHIMARLERLDIAGPGKDVNFTVVGGGATGVELAGALAELRETALDAAFPEVDLAAVHIRLVEHGARRCSRRSTRRCRSTPGSSWRPRRGGAAGTEIREVTQRPGGAGQRRGAAQRRHRLGGRGHRRPAAAGQLGAAAGPRAGASWPGPTCGSAARTASSRSATSR